VPGPRTDDVLRAACLTLLRTATEAEPVSLAEVPRLLSEEDFRRRRVAQVEGDAVGLGGFWKWYESMGDASRARWVAVCQTLATTKEPSNLAVSSPSTPLGTCTKQMPPSSTSPMSKLEVGRPTTCRTKSRRRKARSLFITGPMTWAPIDPHMQNIWVNRPIEDKTQENVVQLW
jgi:hypothetical protein